MARTDGDADSATSEFFVNTMDNAFLDCAPGRDGYATFGAFVGDVAASEATLDAIEAVETKRVAGFGADVPVVPVAILSVRRVDDAEGSPPSTPKPTPHGSDAAASPPPSASPAPTRTRPPTTDEPGDAPDAADAFLAAALAAAFFSLFLLVYGCRWKRRPDPTTAHNYELPGRGGAGLQLEGTDDMFML